jgi:hypothetical protein
MAPWRVARLVAPEGFWARYPYLPPCIFGSALCALTYLALSWLPETVGPHRNFKPHALAGGDAAGDGEGSTLLGSAQDEAIEDLPMGTPRVGDRVQYRDRGGGRWLDARVLSVDPPVGAEAPGIEIQVLVDGHAGPRSTVLEHLRALPASTGTARSRCY